jgi:hypothetical protein
MNDVKSNQKDDNQSRTDRKKQLPEILALACRSLHIGIDH